MASSSITFFAREDSQTANNNQINPDGTIVFELVFTTNTSAPGGGDLTLESFEPEAIDPDTLVSVNGAAPQTFTVLFTGILPPTPSKVPAPLFNQQIVVIELADGTELIFVADPDLNSAALIGGLSTGAINLQNVNNDPPDFPVCFVRGARILTPTGYRAVEDLAVGDKVATRDNGAKPIRWIGATTLYDPAPEHRPVRIGAGALGPGVPRNDVLVSPQHRLLVADSRYHLLFGASEVLVAATAMVGGDGIIIDHASETVEYFHIMFDQHEIVDCEGCAAESFYPGDAALGSLSHATRNELYRFFPALRDGGAAYEHAPFPSVKPFEYRVARRLRA